MILPVVKRHRQHNGHLKSEAPTLFQYMIAIVGINTVLTSFLSLLQQDVARVRHRGLELTMRRASYRSNQKVQAPPIDIVDEAPITTTTTDSIGGLNYNGSNMLELKCQAHQAWNADQLWRDAVIHPEICMTSRNLPSLEEQLYRQEQLALLNETIFSNNADFTPCGAYCLYHLDSAYSSQFGTPIFGWVLRVHETKTTKATTNTSSIHEYHTTGCWQPFNSRTEDTACVVYYYNDWIGYVENVEAKQRHLPMYEKRSSSDNLFPADPKQIQEQMNEHQPKCLQGSAEVTDCFSTSTTAPFCHFRSYDGGTSRVSRKLQDVDTSVVEYRKNLKPSEIVHLFDRYQLDIDNLSDALTLMNETFTQLNASSCNAKRQPENLLLCVYHRQSITRTTAVSGQYGSKVPIKGWQYRTLDRCFIPSENMEYSTTCGRSSSQFHMWSQHMLKYQQQQIQEETAPTKCDRLPLSFGRNAWDSNADEYNFLPPLPKTESPSRGIKYSEQSICGPRILIVGATMCGTNTIATLLSHHPRVKLNRCTEGKPNCDLDHFMAGKESVWEGHGLSHGFVQDRHNYVAKYAQKLPVTDEYHSLRLPNGTSVMGSGSLTIDTSPTYLNTDIFPNIASRAKQVLPNAKIIISLCNPVERMYLEFHQSLLYSKDIFELFFANHNAPVPRNFTELVQYMKFSAEICESNPMFCDELRRDLLRTGIYYKNVQAWRNAFGAENVLVLNMEESNYDKMSKITALMSGYLPENEYPWEILSNVTKSLANELYGGRLLAFQEHKKAFDWLFGFFYRSNVALSEEISAEWPLQWNEKPK